MGSCRQSFCFTQDTSFPKTASRQYDTAKANRQKGSDSNVKCNPESQCCKLLYHLKLHGSMLLFSKATCSNDCIQLHQLAAKMTCSNDCIQLHQLAAKITCSTDFLQLHFMQQQQLVTRTACCNSSTLQSSCSYNSTSSLWQLQLQQLIALRACINSELQQQ